MDSLSELKQERKKLQGEIDTLNQKEREVKIAIGLLTDDFTELIKKKYVREISDREYFSIAKKILEKHFLNTAFSCNDLEVYSRSLELLYTMYHSDIMQLMLATSLYNR